MIAKPHIGMLDGRWAVAPKPHPRSKLQPYTHASAWNFTRAHQWCAARNGDRASIWCLAAPSGIALPDGKVP